MAATNEAKGAWKVVKEVIFTTMMIWNQTTGTAVFTRVFSAVYGLDTSLTRSNTALYRVFVPVVTCI
jgi:hypothetical protein